MLITAVTLLLFNTSQVTAHKMRLANAADAAIYSGMLWEARGLNYHAYLNRAMVANQTSIAQLVSIVSWTNYVAHTTRNMNVLLAWVPLVGEASIALQRTVAATNQFVTTTGAVAVRGLDTLLSALSAAQSAVHSGAALAAQQTVRQVVAANDPRFRVSTSGTAWLAADARNWNRFTKRYRSDEELERKAAVIDESRDDFTENRSWNKRVANVKVFQVRVRKEGETRLLRVAPAANASPGARTRWEWKAKDTLSVHTRFLSCDWDGCSWREDEIPIGWGAAFASASGRDIEYCNTGTAWWFSLSGCPQWARRNRLAEKLADKETMSLGPVYNGVRPYRDLADLNKKNANPTLTMRVEVTMEQTDLRTQATLPGVGSAADSAVSASGIGAGMFYLPDRTAGSALSAVSKGEVFFERPTPRVAGAFGARDSRQEYASLFNPYWDVRLSNPSAERKLIWTLRGISSLFSTGGGRVGGVGS
jgi:hypothetical protein